MSETARAYIEKYATTNRFRKILLSDETPFNLSIIYEQTNNLSNVDDILSVLKSFDVSLLFPPLPLDSTFPCYFNKGNMAWFSTHSGHTRYFTRHFNGACYSYDTVDFLSIYYDTENLSSIAKRLGDKVGIVFLDGFWRKGQEKKYKSNNSVIENIDIIKKKWPVTGRFIENNMLFISVFNEIASSHLQNLNFSYHKDAMFFSSVRYLQERTGIDKGHVSRLLNFMSLIGLIEKVPDEFVPSSYLEKSKEIAKANGWKRTIGYYTVKDWEKNLDTVERVIQIVSSAKISPSNISEKRVISAFGADKCVKLLD